MSSTNSTCLMEERELSDANNTYELIPIPLPMPPQLSEDWYIPDNTAATIQNHQPPGSDSHTRDINFFHQQDNNTFFHPSSSFPSSMFITNLEPSYHHPTPKPIFSSLLSGMIIPTTTTTNNNPLLFDHNNNSHQHQMMGFLEPQAFMTTPSNADATLLGGLGAFPTSLINSSSSDPNNNNLSATVMSCVIPQEQQDKPPNKLALFENNTTSSGAVAANSSSWMLNNKYSNILMRPLESLSPSSGAQPTLFQKRAAQHNKKIINITEEEEERGKRKIDDNEEQQEVEKRKLEMEDIGDGSLLNSYDDYSDHDMVEDSIDNNNNTTNMMKMESESSNKNKNIIIGETSNNLQKGNNNNKKKTGMPAKNLMAERRRRKKLNDRLYMLRSVVPNISKMDRASILGDAIEYMKELLQKINDLHNELQSMPSHPPAPASSSLHHPLTPTNNNTATLPPPPPAASLPSRMMMKETASCPSSSFSTHHPNDQPARVEVGLREGRGVNIHMFCDQKPGLLLSTLTTLDNLGLDIQQAVISFFNGFAMDIFRAEQCNEGQDLHPDQIKAALIEASEASGFHNIM
ncbi:hypothetical protein PIB30_033783 [Stylosanthes scabra]|uniref:BHLH domain-containing protein n=1 Tax=Stylosanthes scabra TaxID=79078 RepID=A0ABU6VBZ4_9FABA|nr:hypothetical protein [Stylosanthes scabra]